MKSQLAQIPKGPIEYAISGDGPVLLVCHGTSSNCFSTEGTKPLEQAGFKILTPSRPGYGRTPLSVGKPAEQAAQSFIALLDNLRIQAYSVVAISGGGPTGIALAAGFPQKVRHLVLLEAISKSQSRSTEPPIKARWLSMDLCTTSCGVC